MNKTLVLLASLCALTGCSEQPSNAEIANAIRDNQVRNLRMFGGSEQDATVDKVESSECKELTNEIGFVCDYEIFFTTSNRSNFRSSKFRKEGERWVVFN